MSGQYSALARYYDALNSGVDYVSWTNFIAAAFSRFGPETLKDPRAAGREAPIVADLACGSGGFTLPLANMGYDMIGVDLSAEMLAQARSKAEAEGRTDILWLRQDIRGLDLYGTVDAAVCCLDSINYLTGAGDLARCFSRVHTFLNPGGLFLFDVNTPYKFENVYGCRDYVIEAENVLCAWRNSYNAKTRLCRFDLTLFADRGDGSYDRFDEVQRERCYPRRTLQRALAEAGFRLCGVFSDFGFTPAPDGGDAERWYFAAAAEK